MQGYKAAEGLTASMRGGVLTFAWRGERNEELRTAFTIKDGQPLIQEMAARKGAGPWIVLGANLEPEFHVTSGKRRMAIAMQRQFELLGIKVTPEVYDKEKWMTFWDAPLVVPGVPGKGDSYPLPRDPSEIRRADATFHSDGCKVNTEGARMSVSFTGLEMGIFTGGLQYTVYRGSNLLRQEAIAKTEQPGIAYIYRAGLKGFDIAKHPAVTWRDTARAWQKYEFGGAVNQEPMDLRARNRLEIVNAGAGSEDRQRRRGIGRGVSSSAQVLLCAGGRGEYRLRLLPQGRRYDVRGGRDDAGTRRGIPSLGRHGRRMETTERDF